MTIATNPNKVIAIIMVAFAIAMLFIIGGAIQTYYSAQIADENLRINREDIEFGKQRGIAINQTNQLLIDLNKTIGFNNELHEDILKEMKAINNNTKHNELTTTPLIHYNSSNSNSNNNTK